MAANGVNVGELRCEGLRRPLGVDRHAPRLSWMIRAERPGVRQTAYQIQVATTSERLAAGRADLWDSGRVESADSIFVPYAGAALQSRQQCHWRVRIWDEAGVATDWSEPTVWEMGLLEPDDWVARWIGRPGVTHSNWQSKVLPAPLLRGSFSLDSGVRCARAYVCGLGYYELYANGQRVGDDRLTPTVTQYDRRVCYRVCDLTPHLQRGGNAIGVILGNGWYNSHTAEVWHFDKVSWRDYPKLLMQIEVILDDGRRFTFASGPHWRVTDSPIVFDGLRNGEHYDARREIPGWSEPGFVDDAWANAAIVPGPGGILCSQLSQSPRVMETLDPAEVWTTADGQWLYDFGQNIAGHVEVTASTTEGDELVFRHGERLTDQRELDQKHIATFIRSGEFQTDRYIAAGAASEQWEPRFVYHGFQYVQVSSSSGVKPEAVRARVVHTAFDKIGSFECSDDTLNQLHDVTLRAYRGNFVGIPTDCPHREKNGWTGDAQLAAETGLMNYDATRAYADWIRSMADVQRPSGQLPGIVPSGGWGFNWGSGPAWDSALLNIPWYVYLYRGDPSLIIDHYDAMKRYVEYCCSMADGHILGFGLGDWCHVDKERMAPVALTSTGYHHANALLMARFAEMTGRAEDQKRFTDLAAHIRRAANKRFYKGDGIYADGQVTALGCALYQGLVEPDETTAVVQRLAAAVEANGCRADFGILGAKYVPRALADHGYVGLAYRLITQPEYPGWVHWLSQGATTLWEDWHGQSSRNHIMFGDIDAWMYHYLAGIRTDAEAPGFRHVRIQPTFLPSLDRVRATYRSSYGEIRVAWHRQEDGVAVTIELPPNTTGTLHTPDGKRRQLGSGRHQLIV